MQCLVSVFLPRGLTQATFTLLGKMLHLKLLFIAIDNGVLKGWAAIMIKAGGISSWPLAFLGFNFCRHCLTSIIYTGEQIVLSLVFSFAVIILLISKMQEIQVITTACLSLSKLYSLVVLEGISPPDCLTILM